MFSFSSIFFLKPIQSRTSKKTYSDSYISFFIYAQERYKKRENVFDICEIGKLISLFSSLSYYKKFEIFTDY